MRHRFGWRRFVWEVVLQDRVREPGGWTWEKKINTGFVIELVLMADDWAQFPGDHLRNQPHRVLLRIVPQGWDWGTYLLTALTAFLLVGELYLKLGYPLPSNFWLLLCVGEQLSTASEKALRQNTYSAGCTTHARYSQTDIPRLPQM